MWCSWIRDGRKCLVQDAETRSTVQNDAGYRSQHIKMLVGNRGLDGHSNGNKQIPVAARSAGIEAATQASALLSPALPTLTRWKRARVLRYCRIRGGNRPWPSTMPIKLQYRLHSSPQKSKISQIADFNSGQAGRTKRSLLFLILLGKREQIPPDAADAVLAPIQLHITGQPTMGQRRDVSGSRECEVPDSRPDLRDGGGTGCTLGDAPPGGHDASLLSPSERGQALNLKFRSPVPGAASLPAAAASRQLSADFPPGAIVFG